MIVPRLPAATAALVLLTGAALPAGNAPRPEPRIEVVNVADGVYAVLRSEHPERRF